MLKMNLIRRSMDQVFALQHQRFLSDTKVAFHRFSAGKLCLNVRIILRKESAIESFL